MKILVIEDHAMELKLLDHLLSAEGHEVSKLTEAETALDAIRHNRPEMILLDLVLPDMDGLTLASKLKSDPETRDIFLVVLTSFPERYPISKAKAAGCDGYLVKPIDTRRITSTLTLMMEAAAVD